MKKLNIKKDILFFLLLLIFSVLGYYLLLSYIKFKEYQKIVPQIELNKKTFTFFFKNTLNQEKQKMFSKKPLSDSETPLPTFHITVKQKDLNTLNENLPKSGKDHYIKAYVRVNNQTYKVKMRYRGDGLYHWAFTQKSLRLKLSKKDNFDMTKKINLINPPGLINYRDEINYKLSKKLGLISPTCKPCRVFINGKYMGVYLYMNQVDESLLRKYKRMPGSIYFGDLHIDDLSKATVTNVWSKESFWEKKASRNAEQKLNREDIKLFIDKINNTDKKGFEKFVETYLNKQKFFTFIALDRAFGAFHHDYAHNHKIYFDPYIGKFEPIAWDLRFWSAIPHKDVSLYPLQMRLADIPKYDAKIDKITYSIISNNFIEDINNSYLKVLNRIKRDLQSDLYRDQAIIIKKISPKHLSVPFSIKDLYNTYHQEIENLISRKKYLLNLYSNTKVYYKIEKLSNSNRRLELIIDGESPVVIKFNKDLKNVIYIDNNITLRDNTILYSGRKIAKNTQNFFNTKLYGTDTIKTIPQKYIFTIKSNLSNKDILKSMQFTNYITSNSVIIKKLNKNLKDYTIGKISYPIFKTKVLSGKIIVNKDLTYDKYTTVKIKKGTTFLLKKGVSIFFYGKVLALGTKQEPIKFYPLNPNNPWGSIVLQGKNTKGSIFKYVEFKDGSIVKHNLIHYTAPFNIHNSPNFKVINCTIGRNFIGDDSMHVAYSKGIVENTTFINARSDGLDIDISDINVTNSIFLNSGNDGLDIMTTKLIAKNNIFINSKDKGISVGEWSDANITDSLFYKTFKGIEIKDNSKVYANNLFIVDSIDKSINLYNKNKRYPKGGQLEADNIYLYNNFKIKKDKKSKFYIKNLYKNKKLDITKYKWYKLLPIDIKEEICKIFK